MLRQALEAREKALGEDHLITLTTVNNLCILLRNQGKYKTAEEMHRRTLEITRKYSGEGSFEHAENC